MKALQVLLLIVTAAAGCILPLVALGYLMGDPPPGVVVDRSPAGWCLLSAFGCWASFAYGVERLRKSSFRDTLERR